MEQLIKTGCIFSISVLFLCSCATYQIHQINVVAKTTDQRRLIKFATDLDENKSVRINAIKKLNDQSVLAKIAIKDKYFDVQRTAINGLNDQMLAKVVAEVSSDGIRVNAVERLTDQILLTKLATEDQSLEVRFAAIDRLTDSTLLSKIATKDENIRVRQRALRVLKIAEIKVLTDQILLTDIVIERDEDCSVRTLALEKIIDQEMLVKIAIRPGKLSCKVEFLAFKKITNKSLLSKIAINGNNRKVRAQAISILDSVPVLELLAGDLNTVDYSNVMQSIARIRLAMYDPIIKKQLIGIEFNAGLGDLNSRYYSNSSGSGGGYIHAETAYCKLSQAGKYLVSKQWSCAFPERVSSTTDYLTVPVNGSEFLVELFRVKAFTLEDLTELLNSNIPEVRISAENRLKQISNK